MAIKIKLFVALLLLAPLAQAQQLAFPSAMGFGKNATGGRGGVVCHVDTLTNSVTGNQIAGNPHYRGSFKYCLDTLTMDRTVVFDVGGKISWSGAYGDTGVGNVTVACHTAPGADGVTMAGGGELIFQKANIIMRFCRLRSTSGGFATGIAGGRVTSGQARNIIFDHGSVIWHGDETLNILGHRGDKIECNTASADPLCPEDITFQYSIVGLAGGTDAGSGNGWGGGSKSMLFYGVRRLSMIRNVNHNSGARNPGAYDGSGEWVNNIFYNHRGQPGFFYAYWDNALWSIIGNGIYRGPMSSSSTAFEWNTYGGAYTATLFIQGNRHITRRPNDTYGENCIFNQSGSTPTCAPWSSSKLVLATDPPVAGSIPKTDPSILTAEAALSLLAADDGQVTNVGPFIPKYDAEDQYAIDGLKSISTESNPANRIGDCPYSGGSKPACTRRPADASDATTQANNIVFETASRAAGYDTDRDGMPDTWETANSLNPADPDDGALIAANGYSNLENYLHEAAGEGGAPAPPAPPPAPGPITIDPSCMTCH